MVGVILASVLVAVVGFWLNSKRAFRCAQDGCSGTMAPLNQQELDDYLEDTADTNPIPGDTVFVPAVPDVWSCDSCGDYVERRG